MTGPSSISTFLCGIIFFLPEKLTLILILMQVGQQQVFSTYLVYRKLKQIQFPYPPCRQFLELASCISVLHLLQLLKQCDTWLIKVPSLHEEALASLPSSPSLREKWYQQTSAESFFLSVSLILISSISLSRVEVKCLKSCEICFNSSYVHSAYGLL